MTQIAPVRRLDGNARRAIEASWYLAERRALARLRLRSIIVHLAIGLAGAAVVSVLMALDVL